ncbi:hypothetical protein SDC9_194763 [bioreactor metagenome]|uniref:Uncharacterized protein n=1 Tax=bioreactor metagenome TaxID=1076179 RepID=A0A645I8M6_9ZZZZ
MGGTIGLAKFSVKPHVLKELFVSFLLVINMNLGERAAGKAWAREVVVEG